MSNSYPIIKYDEFINLYNAGQITLFHSVDAGGTTTRDANFAGKWREESYKREQAFVRRYSSKSPDAYKRICRAHGKDEQIVEAGLALEFVSNADYAYFLMSIPIAPEMGNAQVRQFISIKGFEGTAAHRYVELDQTIANRVMSAARQQLKDKTGQGANQPTPPKNSIH